MPYSAYIANGDWWFGIWQNNKQAFSTLALLTVSPTTSTFFPKYHHRAPAGLYSYGKFVLIIIHAKRKWTSFVFSKKSFETCSHLAVTLNYFFLEVFILFWSICFFLCLLTLVDKYNIYCETTIIPTAQDNSRQQAAYV